MAKLRVKFTFPQEQIKEPVIWQLGRDFDVITNIRRADITAEVAWTILEIEGEQADIDRGIQWVMDRGIRVDPVEDSIIEG
jgi:L-aspartate semialdehyde sulfurtransferase ferredoxin